MEDRIRKASSSIHHQQQRPHRRWNTGRCICSLSGLYQFISCRSLVRSWLLMKAHASMDVLLGRPAASPIHKDNSRFGSVRKEGYLYITGWHTHLIGHHPVSLLGNVNCYPTTEVPVFFVPASSNAKFAIFILEGKLGTVPPLVQLHCELQSFSIIWILHTAL